MSSVLVAAKKCVIRVLCVCVCVFVARVVAAIALETVAENQS